MEDELRGINLSSTLLKWSLGQNIKQEKVAYLACLLALLRPEDLAYHYLQTEVGVGMRA